MTTARFCLLSVALGLLLGTPGSTARAEGKIGVDGELLLIEKSGSYDVKVKDKVQINISIPVGIGGDPDDYAINVEGGPGVLSIDGVRIIKRKPMPIGAVTIAAFLTAKKAGNAKILAGIKGKPTAITVELEVK